MPSAPRRRIGTATLSLLLAIPAARGEEPDPWDVIAQGSVTPQSVGPELDGLVTRLDAAGFGYLSGDAVVYAKDEADRVPMAERVGTAIGRAKEALSAAGFSLDGFDTLKLVSVKAAYGAAGTAISSSGNALFVRTRTAAVRPVALGLAKRLDGPSPLSDVLRASDEAMESFADRAGEAGSRAGPGSLPNAVARVLLAHVRLDPEPPAWLREGLVAWLEVAAFPESAEAPIHVCGGAAGASLAMLSPKVRPTGSQARVLGVLVAAALKGATDGPARTSTLSTAGEGAAKAIAAMVGRDPKDLLAEAAKRAQAGTWACDAAGTVPCPVCRGGHVETACAACGGLGQVACPSCDGDPACFAAGCLQGVQSRKGGDEPCKMCFGTGWFLCRTCGDKARFPCLLCGGSGRASRVCLVCRGKGRVPCPDAAGLAVPEAGEASCPWCEDTSVKAPCATCRGCGFVGCRTCRGSGRVPCESCHGAGCDQCGHRGSQPCPDGDPAKQKCPDCRGTGRVAADPSRCPACGGTGKAPGVPLARARLAERRRGIDAALRAQNVAVIEKGVKFLLTCRQAGEPFALRDQRWIPNGTLGDLEKPTLFSNALVVWTLLSSGLSADQPELGDALRALRHRAEVAAFGTRFPPDVHVQSVSLALRALLFPGADPDGILVTALVKRLVDAQRPSGHWAEELVSKDPGSAFQSLFAVESLWLAQRRGAKVPASTWTRALAAGLKISSAIPKQMQRNGFLTATDVASNTALIIMAKAGSLGDKAKDLDEYRSIPQVAQGLAWLDRWFDLEREPIVASGALVRSDSDGGYTSWIYALERLGQLLSIDLLGGRRWYVEGCRKIAKLQLADGGFEELHPGRMNGPVRSTCMSLLFLTRATPPITGEPAPGDTGDEDKPGK